LHEKTKKTPTKKAGILRTILTEAKTPAKTIQKTNWHQKQDTKKNWHQTNKNVTHYRVLKEHTPAGATPFGALSSKLVVLGVDPAFGATLPS
ncbi:hypothetical protein, partial [Gordonia sp. (in: high G+C Gram-positive bacteria)]|uniref:hypothetical protein n=1 Tax=Gordonia sp. (in: high G+C Gram-positive bacteria) TaxID=84139 RepID=UPI0039E5D5DE